MTADETIADPTKVTEPEVEDKGKGKVATEETPADETMDEDDSDDEEAAGTYKILLSKPHLSIFFSFPIASLPATYTYLTFKNFGR